MGSTQEHKYQRAVAEIRRRIKNGEYASDELPPAARLAEQLGVAEATARRALSELDREGLTGSRRGRSRVVIHGTDSSAASRYERTAEAIRRDITQGAFMPGDPLPGELELAERFHVSRATVRQALALLERNGEVERRSGRRYVPGSATSSDLAYERVAAQIRKSIMSGTYTTGAKLPGEHRLSTDFSVSRPTIRHALQILERDGIVYSLPKQGWYVTDRC